MAKDPAPNLYKVTLKSNCNYEGLSLYIVETSPHNAVTKLVTEDYLEADIINIEVLVFGDIPDHDMVNSRLFLRDPSHG